MNKTIYRLITRSDDGNVKHDGRKYHASRSYSDLEEIERKQNEWNETSPTYIQFSENGGKQWEPFI